jgi:adenine-specific DNA-methyltransferase
MNPPYRKINTDSAERVALREIGVETSNLYTGFLSVALRLLAPTPFANSAKGYDTLTFPIG